MLISDIHCAYKNLSSVCYTIGVLVISLSFTFSCKSAKKSFKRGDYINSVLLSSTKLKDTPAHQSSIAILKAAYPAALRQQQNDIRHLVTSDGAHKWETVLKSYTQLNQLYQSIMRCDVCQTLVKAQNFEKEESQSRIRAAETRYREANKLFELGGKENARLAFTEFEKVEAILPGYKNTQEQLQKTYDIAALKILVEPVKITRNTYNLSNTYFQNSVNEYFQTSQNINKFVKFYDQDQADQIRLRPDQIITLHFEDFTVGQTLIDRNTETCTSADSVKVSEKTVRQQKVMVYEKVSAKLTQNKKMVKATGILNLKVLDYRTKRLISEEKFTSEYSWMCEWHHYTGDERALTPAQIKLCKSRELETPMPQQLFAEFSKPVFEQLSTKVRSLYVNY